MIPLSRLYTLISVPYQRIKRSVIKYSTRYLSTVDRVNPKDLKVGENYKICFRTPMTNTVAGRYDVTYFEVALICQYIGDIDLYREFKIILSSTFGNRGTLPLTINTTNLNPGQNFALSLTDFECRRFCITKI